MFLLNSRLGRFSAAPFRGHPFSRSYGVILPSSLTRVIPRALGFSPRLPVSVCGTGAMRIAPFGALEAFLGNPGQTCFGTLISLAIVPQNHPPDFPGGLSSELGPETNTRPGPPLCVTPSLLTAVPEYQPVVHHLRYTPRLRSRLTLSGRALPRKP